MLFRSEKLGEEKLLVADLNLVEIRQQRLNNRMFHQRRPEIYTPITQSWQPWAAYPDMKPFSHSTNNTASLQSP